MSRQLPDFLDGYMEYTKNTEPPDLFRLWTGLSAISSCLKRKCFLRLGLERTYANLYVVLIGPSGSRKGTAMRPARRLLDRTGITLAAEAITRQALIQELVECKDSYETAPGTPAQYHCSLTVHSQEFGVFLGYDNRDMILDLCDWFDCGDDWTYRTRGRGPERVKGVWVNILGATTPTHLHGTLAVEAIGEGLTSRIIFVFEREKGKTIPLPPPPDADLEECIVHDLQDMQLLSGDFNVTPQFAQLYAEWYMTHKKHCHLRTDMKFDGYMDRRQIHMQKLCMLLNVSKGEDMMLDIDDWNRALSILRATEVKMAETFGAVGKADWAPYISRVQSVLAMNKVMTKEELLAIFYKEVDGELMKKIINTFLDMKVLKYEVKNKSVVYHWIGRKA